MIETFARLFPDEFKWRTEPYEYVSDRPAIDLLYGHSTFREWVDKGQPIDAAPGPSDKDALKLFEDIRQPHLLY